LDTPLSWAAFLFEYFEQDENLRLLGLAFPLLQA
jgi:hypothetical protein